MCEVVSSSDSLVVIARLVVTPREAPNVVVKAIVLQGIIVSRTPERVTTSSVLKLVFPGVTIRRQAMWNVLHATGRVVVVDTIPMEVVNSLLGTGAGTVPEARPKVVGKGVMVASEVLFDMFLFHARE